MVEEFRNKMVSNTKSVHEQVTHLCEKILKDSSPVDQHSNDILIKNLRSLSFEILLKKSDKSCVCYAEEELDAASKILAYSYRLYQWNLNLEAAKLHELTDSLQNLSLASSNTIEAILLFLVNLADETPSKPMIRRVNSQAFRAPCNTKVKPYLEFMPQVFEPPCIFDLAASKSFPFSKEPGTGLMLLGKRSSTSAVKVKWCSEEISFTDLKKPRSLKIPKILSPADNQYKDEGYGSPSQDPSMTLSCRLEPLDSEIWEIAQERHLPALRTWESLGSLEPSKEKPFLTEAGPDCINKLWKSTMGLEHLYLNRNKTEYVLLSISREQLVQDLKFLLVGIPSQTFQYNEKQNGFILKNDIFVEGLTPGTLSFFYKDFLIAGSCYLRLERLVTYNSVHEGLIFQALCGSMRRYLHLYRSAVMLLPDGPLLLNLRKQMDDLYIQITCLASLCKVHPDQTDQVLPEGVALLAYLYQEIQNMIRKDVACVLYSALQACCQVYFKFLQQWMFEGVCQDTYTEFFIQQQSELMTSRQREYWSQGHYLLAEAVPGFLYGLEVAIFQCGKAVNLLKLCNPQDPLCVLVQGGYPNIHCCLHNSELQSMEAEWLSYKYRALHVCGDPLSLSRLLHRSQEEEWAFQAAIQTSQMERLQALRLEREAELAMAASAKSKQLAFLKEQMLEAEERKRRERKERLEEDKRLMKEALEMDRKEAEMLAVEKAALEAKYSYLSEVAEKRRQHAEKQIKHMKQGLINLNDNEQSQDVNSNITDNIMSETESKSNSVATEDIENSLSHINTRFTEKSTKFKYELKDEENGNSVVLTAISDDNELDGSNEEHVVNVNVNSKKPIPRTADSCVTAVSSQKEENVSDSLIRTDREAECTVLQTESNTTFETASAGSDPEAEVTCGVMCTTKVVCYTKYMSLGETPLVDISRRLSLNTRKVVPQVMDLGTTDVSSISIAIRKSILLPLRIQASLVNSALLKLFLEKEELLSHLHSLRSYFFLLDGEFGRNITGALFECMYHAASPADMLNSVTLNSILNKSLTHADPNVDRLSFDVKYIPPHFSFSSPLSLDCVMLQYKVGWPLNIILTSTALHKYNDVFGFLLRLRRISWVLEEDFHRLKRATKEIPDLLRSPEYHQLQLYRHEMTHFIHAIQTYVTATVLQASWVEFLKNLQKAHTLDDLYRMHVAYVKMVLFRCLLNKQSVAIQKALVDTLRMVLKFHGQLSSGTWQRKSGVSHYHHPKFTTLVQIYTSFHNLAAFIFKFATKLANTGYQPHLLDLLQMLNMNGFYPEQF